MTQTRRARGSRTDARSGKKGVAHERTKDLRTLAGDAPSPFTGLREWLDSATVLLIEVETDEELVGYGESIGFPGD